MTRPKSFINQNDLEWEERTQGASYAYRRKRFGAATGADKLGASLFEAAPGKRGFPFHNHTVNDEAIFVLAGTGRVRLAGGEQPIGPGDYVTFRAGEDHQVIAGDAEPLRFLAMSTNVIPEVSEYPDSNKIFAITGRTPTGAAVGSVHREEVDYWDGEPV